MPTLVITIHKAEGLRDTQTFGRQDPFVTVQVAGQTARSSTTTDGGTAPSTSLTSYRECTHEQSLHCCEAVNSTPLPLLVCRRLLRRRHPIGRYIRRFAAVNHLQLLSM